MSEVVIRAIAAGGDGVATLPDGRTVFVPRTAPGDLVRLTSIRMHARFARARIGELLQPGPDRVDPVCPHYIADQCGGCQLMHMTAEAQQRAKASVAGDAMRRIAKLDIADPTITPSPQQLRYRSKMTLTHSRGRLGYHQLEKPDQIFDLRECLLVEPGISDLHKGIRRVSKLLPADTMRVVFRRDRAGGHHVVIRTDGTKAWTGGKQLHAASRVDATIWWQPEKGAPRAVAGSDDPWPVTVFEQVHPAMGAIVRERALALLGNDVNGKRIWDLYAGIGETTKALAERGASVESVELDRRAVELAERLGPSGPRRLAGSVEENLSRLGAAEIVVTNPPRLGMSPAAITGLMNAAPARVIYISCDPATLARDIQRIGPGYSLTAFETFDQFPQTAHLESIAVLESAIQG